jgi:FAD/FMN-containing dehydrogenase
MVGPADLSALERAIDGDVIPPDAPGYDAARKPAIARFHDARPAVVVRCHAPGDVAEALAFARRSGLETAVRGGGHCLAGRSTTAGVLVDVGPLRSVAVADGVATIGAGARLGDIYDALAEDGATIAGGCGPAVGIAGLTLGGGLGILGRRHGLTSDQLLGARVVLPDGRVADCDDGREQDLFWALRGAGAGLGAVAVSFAFRTLPAPAATCFHLTWPSADAPAVLDAWQRWAPAARDELAASLHVSAGGDPARPPRAHVFGALLGGEAEAADVLGELVAASGADPDSSRFTPLPYRAAKQHLADHGPGEEPAGEVLPYSKSEFFGRPLPPDAIAALVAHVGEGRVAGQARELDFTPWGGAYNRVAADATAFVHREDRFLLKYGVALDAGASEAERTAARRWLARAWEIAHPYGSGRAYQNFPDPELADEPLAYYGANAERVARVRARLAVGR